MPDKQIKPTLMRVVCWSCEGILYPRSALTTKERCRICGGLGFVMMHAPLTGKDANDA